MESEDLIIDPKLRELRDLKQGLLLFLKGEKMIDFIVKLEEILKNSGNEDWGIKYVPEKDGYLLRLDDDFILMTKVESDRY